MYSKWTQDVKSMKGRTISNFGLIDAKIRASDKE